MKRADKVGFGVIGLGNIAKTAVLPAFSRCKHATLTALAGRDRDAVAPLARKFRVRDYYGTPELAQFFANPAVSAVYIATQQGHHHEFALRAAKAGKHVLCEKPLAATVAQAERMVNACREHGVLLMTAYRKYFEPSALFVKSLLRSGALGSVDVIHTSFSELYVPGKSPAWLVDPQKAGGGPLMDLGVYCVNTTRWLLDESPLRVTAESWKRDKKHFRHVEQGISFRMEFPGGAIVLGSTSYGAALSSLLFIQGTKGWLLLAPAYPFETERFLTGVINGKRIQKHFPRCEEFAPQIDAFATAIRNRTKIEPDGEDGLLDLKIIRAIYDSARPRRPARVS